MRRSKGAPRSDRMVAPHMAYFVRARPMEIKRLEKRPQESLEVVHTIISASIKDVLEKVRKEERAFYGGRGKSALDEVKQWSTSIKHLAAMENTPFFNSVNRIDAILRLVNEPSAKFKFNMHDVARLKECMKRTLDAVPGKFLGMMDDIRELLMYMEKYCLSFYDEENEEVEYETAAEYDRQRKESIKIVSEQLDAIVSTGEKFRMQGFFITDLTTYGVELSRKLDCGHAPFMLMFADCCEHIRVACKQLQVWIEADSHYDLYVRNDIVDLDEHATDSERTLRELQQKFYQLGFRVKQLTNDVSRLEGELARLECRDDELTVEEEVLTNETNDMQTAIEAKEFRRDNLIRNAAVMHPHVLYEKYTEISEELRELKRALPGKQRALMNVKSKLQFISEKKSDLEQAMQKLEEVKEEAAEVDTMKQEEDINHTAALKLVDKAKQIHLFKSTPDAVTKIYHEQPIEVNKARLPGQRGENDPFERACALVCSLIESDWPKLYRALPFYPPRGDRLVDADIRTFDQKDARSSNDVVCQKALVKWRRYHTRAKLEDLTQALRKVRRHDITTKISISVTAQPQFEDDDEGIDDRYSYVDASLVPYVKQVERFDKLLAQGRFKDESRFKDEPRAHKVAVA